MKQLFKESIYKYVKNISIHAIKSIVIPIMDQMIYGECAYKNSHIHNYGTDMR